jgi:hypothetical protein
MEAPEGCPPEVYEIMRQVTIPLFFFFFFFNTRMLKLRALKLVKILSTFDEHVDVK